MPARMSTKKSAERKRPTTARGVSELKFLMHRRPQVSGRALVKLLHSFGYETVRQFCLVVVGGAFEEGSEFARARRVAQLAQGFGFNLADAFASDGE